MLCANFHNDSTSYRCYGWTVFRETWVSAWWRHQMDTFSALLAICAGNSPVSGEFPAQRPVTRSFDVYFDLRLNKRLSKQSWGWWFETQSRPLWRHRNGWVSGEFSVLQQSLARIQLLLHTVCDFELCLLKHEDLIYLVVVWVWVWKAQVNSIRPLALEMPKYIS